MLAFTLVFAKVPAWPRPLSKVFWPMQSVLCMFLSAFTPVL